ncbi:hypothetical protein ACHAXT_001195 [Thalassiosira profunda]
MSVLQFRRQPSPGAFAGVSSFVAGSLYWVHAQKLSVATSAPLLLLVAAAVSSVFLFIEPIPQPQAYHNFADKRVFLCSCHGATEGFFLPPDARTERRRGFIIPNFGDVISNVVILAGGIFGLLALKSGGIAETSHDTIREWQVKVCLPTFFAATIAVSAGSSYYHWNPMDATLVWDRLPMTLAFVSIFCYMLEEYLPTSGIGRALMVPLLAIGAFSVLYWRYTDDLRLYALVQFGPLATIAALLTFCEARHGGAFQHALGLLFYALAKVCEDNDYVIFAWTKRRISGHSLKHVLAGLASVSIATAV